MEQAKRGLWARAEAMAMQAPPERNRYVDFLRAFSILAVVIGHWLVAAPYMKDGAVQGGHLLGILPWSQWLTWGFQVMPLFFLVGGFSNGMSWSATQRKSGGYVAWFGSRVHRLVNPVLPLFLIWTLFALFGTAAGVERRVVALAAQLALIPVWFLSVYLMVSAVVPWTYALWRRFGLASFWGFVAGAVLIDLLSIRYGVPGINFANFAFVWLAVHQLGYAWGEGQFASPAKALPWAVGGALALGLLVGRWPRIPVAMIGVPGSGTQQLHAAHARTAGARYHADWHCAVIAGTRAANARSSQALDGCRADQWHDHDDLSLASDRLCGGAGDRVADGRHGPACRTGQRSLVGSPSALVRALYCRQPAADHVVCPL